MIPLLLAIKTVNLEAKGKDYELLVLYIASMLSSSYRVYYNIIVATHTYIVVTVMHTVQLLAGNSKSWPPCIIN
jgi:hypothetical protein